MLESEENNMPLPTTAFFAGDIAHFNDVLRKKVFLMLLYCILAASPLDFDALFE